MHICLATLSYPSASGGSGVANQTWLLGHALASAGHRVSVVALAEPGEVAVGADGAVDVYRMRRGSLHWLLFRVPKIGPRLSGGAREIEDGWHLHRLIQRIHHNDPIDVIEGTETGCIVLASRLSNIPLVIRLHGERYTIERYVPGRPLSPGVRTARLVQRMALRRAQQLIAPSRAHAEEISRELKGSHPPMRVIQNIVELPGIPGADVKTGERERSPVVLYAGRLETGKGILTLLEAAPALFSQCPDACIIIVGERHPTLNQLDFQRRLAEASRFGRVEVRGAVGAGELAQLYAKASVCVVPSFYEIFGLTAFEPALAGTPVVAARTSALEEFLQDNETAILVPPGDAVALAEAVARYLRDSKLRQRIAANAHKMVLRDFARDRVVPRNIAVYHSLGASPEAVCTSIRHIFFSPHPDDVSWSCGGLVASLASNDVPVSVITVFGCQSSLGRTSAFARHLAAKWNTLGGDFRRQEDATGMRELGVTHWESWEFQEAPARMGPNGAPIYASYEELLGQCAEEDKQTANLVWEQIMSTLGPLAPCRVYLPLAVGNHVDHQLLYRTGLRLMGDGFDVRFYEDWPYVASGDSVASAHGWQAELVRIDMTSKLRSAERYRSQLAGVGGTRESLARRLRAWNQPNREHPASERIWRLLDRNDLDNPEAPYARRVKSPHPGFGHFLRTLRWHDVDEVLPVGSGICADVGCGQARHKSIIEGAGYTWLGIDMDRRTDAQPFIQGAAEQLPLEDETVAVVVLWQVLEYMAEPLRAFAEAARVLEPGGVVCGSVSFLEPVHGKTWYGINPLALEQALRAAGLVDITLSPGLNGFSLMSWTFFRRLLGARSAGIALALTAGWLLPVMGTRYAVSRVRDRLGVGTGHGASWVTSGFPLEFAGHIQFSARRPARAR